MERQARELISGIVSLLDSLRLGRALLRIIEDDRSTVWGNINVFGLGLVFVYLSVSLVVSAFAGGFSALADLLGLFVLVACWIFCTRTVRDYKRVKGGGRRGKD